MTKANTSGLAIGNPGGPQLNYGTPEFAEFIKTHPLRHAVEEFVSAEAALKRMNAVGVGDFDEFESAWREFLHRLERVWVKTQAAVHSMPKWKRIEEQIASLRRKDELLRYLQQARNVDEHSIAGLTKDWDPQIKSKFDGGDVVISWQPWDRPLLPVKNRGVIYEPPKMHLGKNIEFLKHKGKPEPVVIAELGMQFYVTFLNRVLAEVLRRK